MAEDGRTQKDSLIHQQYDAWYKLLWKMEVRHKLHTYQELALVFNIILPIGLQATLEFNDSLSDMAMHEE